LTFRRARGPNPDPGPWRFKATDHLALALAALLAVGALACVPSSVSTKPLAAQTGTSADGPRLRVLTYNIHHGEGTDGRFDYQRLASIIHDLQPDIVALQEVDRWTERADSVDQVSVLAELTGMHWAYGVALYYQGGEYGEALLSRFPLEDVRAHHLPFRPRQEPRTALRARLAPDNGLPELIFVGTHLCHESEDTRTEQVRRLDLVLPVDGPPVILAGDLNARAGSAPMNILLDGRWLDATAPDSEIDYVLVRRDDPWRVVEVRVLDQPLASDHDPVLVILEWLDKAHGDSKGKEPEQR
jgi:endonuclease/exonuclease/phosphatase family metal-dependent hydrolase